MRVYARNPRLKAEGRFCLRKSWKAEGKNFGPLARLFVPSVFSLFIYKKDRLNFLLFMTEVQE